VHPSGSRTGAGFQQSSTPALPSSAQSGSFGAADRREPRAALQRVAIIPSRYGSSRFPGKPLADLDGRPMIEHVYRRAAASASIDAVIVATDDPRIAQVIERIGGRACLTRATHPTGTDRLAEVAEDLDCELVVNVQGDLPLLEPAMIDEAVAPFHSDATLMMSTLRRRIDDPADLVNPNVVKVVVDRDGYALYFSRAAVPYVRDGSGASGESRFYKHVGLYVYRREFLLAFARLSPTPLERAEALEQLRALEHGFRIKTVETAFDFVEVDTPDDLERVRRHTASART
jgi:3-deoxy-manno-octulosonate cytidylyltransferase (CMP-KDO synthetase)